MKQRFIIYYSQTNPRISHWVVPIVDGKEVYEGVKVFYKEDAKIKTTR